VGLLEILKQLFIVVVMPVHVLPHWLHHDHMMISTRARKPRARQV
jgi:hypothetical protein